MLGLNFLLAGLALPAQEGSLASTSQSNDRLTVAVEALSRLKGVDLEQNSKIKEAVLKLLDRTRGTPHFLKIVQQFNLSDQNAGLLDLAVLNCTNETGAEAARLLLAKNGSPLAEATLNGTNNAVAARLAEALGNSGKKETAQLLLPVLTSPAADAGLRKHAVHALAQNSEGANGLLRLAKENKLRDDLKLTVSSELSQVHWPEIKAEAASLLPRPEMKNAQPLPAVSELLKMKGDPINGGKVFSNPAVGCAGCHQVKGQGIDFGPNLSEVGSKLAREAILESILEPSAGISFGFEAWQVQLKSGDEAYGLVVSDTAEELAVKAVGGIVTRYKKSEIAHREQSKLSIMPSGLQQAMTPQELVDLIEYLSSLKKAP